MNKQLIIRALSPIIKFLLIALVALLSSLGVLALIAIYNYTYNIGNLGSLRHNYIFALSEKTSLDGWIVKESFFNDKFNKNKKMGEFRREFVKNELDDKRLLSNKDPKMIGGKIYVNGGIQGAEINPETFDIVIKEQPITWRWRWYNWVGIGIDKVHQQTVEEIVNTPLPAN